MRNILPATVAVPLLLSGCATGAGQMSNEGASPAAEAIVYSAGRCRGFCPAFSIRLAADGSALFDGGPNALVQGERRIAPDAERFRRVAAALAPARPAKGDRSISQENCTAYVTDHQVITVSWQSAGITRTLAYDLGCQDEALAPVREALARARALLPLEGLVPGSRS